MRLAEITPSRVAAFAARAVLLALPACAPTLPETGPEPPSALVDVYRAMAAAQAELAAGDWDAAALHSREAADAAARDERLGGWRDAALYNLACVEARAGRVESAAAAFAESIAHGLRAPQRMDATGAWTSSTSALRLEHILADPDLDAIRELPAYRAALDRYLDADHADSEGGPVVRVTRAGTSVDVTISAPIELRDGTAALPARRWVLGDGDLRWGVRRVRGTVERVVAQTGVREIEIAAADEDTSNVAWAAALEVPELVASIDVRGVTTPRAAWEDALARLHERRKGLAPWKVVVGPRDDVVVAALATIGVTATRAGR